MLRNSIVIMAIAASLGAAFAAGSWMTHRTGNDVAEHRQSRPGSLPEPSSFDQSAPLEDRMHALEQAINDERYARQLLQDELFVLTEEIDLLTADHTATGAADASSSPQTAAVPAGSRGTRGTEGRVARLTEAGFSPGQADWIVQRESQLQMEALQARYEAERTGNAMDFFQSRTAATDALRNELGDAEYQRYLDATGRPTTIAVSSVLESSPAQRAGLRPGDEIVSYGGKRIFSMSDLTREIMEGQPGEPVVVDFLRDGVNMQMTLPRGPIGISGGR